MPETAQRTPPVVGYLQESGKAVTLCLKSHDPNDSTRIWQKNWSYRLKRFSGQPESTLVVDLSMFDWAASDVEHVIALVLRPLWDARHTSWCNEMVIRARPPVPEKLKTMGLAKGDGERVVLQKTADSQ